ncbi:hypothetical protein FCL47_23550 [Desulfopila sp. IMCC35006]|uniref:hypothetical protein n=1 Tax=Desulfopila sp. IMCC35006 TaxID=2569542 RepID=UPI0010AB76DF|nr:hypothetical protein [Desulfopila sp. IMCC35006]TKB23191.1 hypothetical protein FCL47_23550 [Desulfopila sp. IMCC35006]
MGNIRRKLREEKRPAEISVKDRSIEKDTTGRLILNKPIKVCFKNNVVETLNGLSIELSIDRIDLIRLAVDQFILQKSIQAVLNHMKPPKKMIKPRKTLKVFTKSTVLKSLIGVSSLERFKLLAVNNGLSVASIFRKAIDCFDAPHEKLDRNKCHNTTLKRFDVWVDAKRINRLSSLALVTADVNRSYIVREIIESFLLNVEEGKITLENE